MSEASGGLALGIAVSPGPRPDGWQRALAWAERAEALGLHSLWVPEGHFQRGAMAAPLVTLAACAARTRRLRLGTTSLLLPIHHPLRVAGEVATLDAISGGRVVLGLGRGFREPLFQGFGVARESKRDRLDAALDAILEAWASGAPGLRPVQRPHPPLLMAAFGPKGLRQAASRRLAYLASPLESLDVLEENWAIWRDHAAGEPEVPPRVPVMRTVHVAETDREAESVLAALEAERSRVGASLPRSIARAAGGRLEDRVLVGRPPAVLAAIERYRERIGMDLLVVRSESPGVSPEASHASLERLVAEVLPQLRARAPRA